MTPRDLAEQICRTLRKSGHQAYLVGGCVRDLLLGREPSDYDVATDARPERVLELFPGSITVGARFGVILVVEGAAETVAEGAAEGEANGAAREGAHAHVEVATFRSDIGSSDGRHPDRVEYASSPEEDVRRRDFTINGLMLDPETGEVLDFVGGREDLRAGLVRAIGTPDLRFREDKLRTVRAVRFAARLGYAIEGATFAAIRAAAPQVLEVSAERLRDELTKLLTEGAARRAFELLEQAGLLAVLLPEVARMQGVEQPPQYHPEGDVWIHTRMMLEGLLPRASATLAWGVLLHDVGKPPTFRVAPDRIRFDGHVEVGVRMAEAICHRLHFSNDDTKQIVELVANHMRFADVERMKESTLKRFMRLPGFDEHLELHRIDSLSSHGNLSLYDFVRERRSHTSEEEIRPALLLNGDDLIRLGYRPGPEFREILGAIEDAQLEGTLHTREEALSFVLSQFPLAS